MISKWNDTEPNHPVLAPRSTDHVCGSFDIDVAATEMTSNSINLSINYRLKSPYLNQLVQNGAAHLQTLLTDDEALIRETTLQTHQQSQCHSLKKHQ